MALEQDSFLWHINEIDDVRCSIIHEIQEINLCSVQM